MPCLWRKTASFPAKPVERRYHPTLSPLFPSPTAPSLEAVRDARNKRESERAGQVEEKDAADGFHVWWGGLSPRREHLCKGLKPGEEWAVCRWKRSVFQGNQREGKCSVTGGWGGWGFQRTARVPCGPAPERRRGEWGSFSQTFPFFTRAASISR